MNIGERIKAAMKAKGVTQKELVKSLEAPQPTISRWINSPNPSQKLLESVAEICGEDLEWLRSEKGHSNHTDQQVKQVSRVTRKAKKLDKVGSRAEEEAQDSNTEQWQMVPVISMADVGKFLRDDEFLPEENEIKISLRRSVSSRAFAVRVSGDAMEPAFCDGDLIICDPDVKCELGSYVVAVFENDFATLRKYIMENNGLKYISVNERYEKFAITKNPIGVARVCYKYKEY